MLIKVEWPKITDTRNYLYLGYRNCLPLNFHIIGHRELVLFYA